MIPGMRHLAIALCLLTSLACAADAQQSAAPNDVAARVGDRAISMKEVDDRWQKEEPGQKAQAEQALYDGRRAALEAIVADMLIAQAAKTKGITPEAFVQGEMARLKKPVSDTDVRNFYVQNSERMQGRTFEQMSAPIQQYLSQQEEDNAKRALIAELKKSGPAMRVMMDAPRTTVALAPTDPAQGAASAPVTIVEYSDFQCPFCQRVMPTIKQLRTQYGDKVRVVWKDFPLTQVHPQAFVAAQAGNCAQEQGKFWELHDQLFANQQALQPDNLKKYAAAVGMDAAKFNACLDSAKFEARVQASMAEGGKLGVQSTPTVFINGRMVSGAQPIEVFQSLIDEELARK
jgi:protein-disulfide isomerase